MTNTQNTTRRRRTWLMWAGAGVTVTLLVVGAILFPKKSISIVTVDGVERWADAQAPPRRDVVWTTAERVTSQPFEQLGKVSHIRPQPAEYGNVMYFTVRTPEDQYDIYQVRRTGGGWSDPEPVTVLNSEKNDIGPVLRADGKVLYLYSDRDGGLGGMDLYVATRTDSGWSEPQNLGSQINSPAHEYDPAVTPSGDQLFFASNRSEKLHRQLREGRFDPAQDHWNTTLRADLGLRKFDLYVAEREASQWEPAEPLRDVNTRNYNEGAPHISPNGAFLYFVSDRPVREGEEENFDVFRTRTHQPGKLVENLGPGVNTSANEIEPSLSSEGFRLFFSRDIDQKAAPLQEQYALFQSQAEEVETDVVWEADNYRAAVAWLNAVFRTFGDNWWQILLGILLLALTFAAIRFLRRVSWRHARLPGFLIFALVLHLLLATGSFFTYFGKQIVEQITQTFDEEVVVTQVLTQSNQSHEQGEESYEKVADLATPDVIQMSEIDRQVTTTPNVPAPIETAAPQIPSRMTRETPDDAVVATVLVETQPNSAPTPLQRQPVATQQMQEQIDTVETRAVQESPLSEMQTPEVELARATRQPVDTPTPKSLEVENPAMRVMADVVEVDQTAAAAPQQTETELQVTRAPRAQVVQTEPIETETVEARTAVAASESSEAVEVAVDRAVMQTPADATLPARVAVQQANPLRLAQASPGARPPTTNLPKTNSNTPLQRATKTSVVPDTLDANVDLASTAAVEQMGASESETPVQVAIALPRANKVADLEPLVRRPRIENVGADSPRTASAELVRAPVSRLDTPQRTTQPALTRMQRVSPETVVEQQEVVPTEAVAGAETESPNEKQTVAETAVQVARAERLEIEIPMHRGKLVGGRTDPLNSRIVIGTLAKDEVDAPVSTSPIASRLLRRRARAPDTQYADDSVNLRSLLKRRVVDANTKAEIVKKFGGSDETLQIIQQGISWIESHQHKDGHWSLHQFNHNCQGHAKCSGHGGSQSDTAGTGLALLPLLGDGNTHQKGRYKDAVARGITWLVSHQKKDGDLFTGGERNAWMYSHGIATIALCECYGMSGDAALRGPAQRAIDFIVDAQHEASGGWRYQPKQPGDTSVVGWQVMALKSGQMADLHVPQRTLDGAKKWLAQAAGKGGRQGQFFYQNGRFNPAMTAEGMLCMEYLGSERSSAQLVQGGAFLLKNLPQQGKESSYYWYYGTQAMFHLQGDHWDQWNDALHSMLLKSQVTSGPTAGTWDPRDSWEGRGGRIYATSLRLLMLEVYYRHLPLFQVLEETQ